MTVRRLKTYAGAQGYVYQYYFFEGNRAHRGSSHGGEFTYVISADRQSAFPFKIFVHQSALESWAAQNGRPLYSKMPKSAEIASLNGETVTLNPVPYGNHSGLATIRGPVLDPERRHWRKSRNTG